ncbi:MAG: hypothetical protein HY670_04755 [Chloroflexi bacterium]|nr:hypothetical protein [Chloroflexota bacterium]
MEIEKVVGVNAFCEKGTMPTVTALFRDVLGARIGPEQSWLEEYGFQAIGAWLGLDTGYPFRVEISESVNEGIGTGRQIRRSAPSFQVLQLLVDDIDRAIAQLRRKGIRVGDKVLVKNPGFDGLDGPGFYQSWIHPEDSRGLIIALLQFGGKTPGDGNW